MQAILDEVIEKTQNFSDAKRDEVIRVRLKVLFHSSEKITGAEVAESSGCDYFDRESLRVAQKIKIKPEIKNGEAIMATKLIEYSIGF